MKVTNKYMSSVDLDNMAGLGISAWSRDGVPAKLFVSKYQGSTHIVRIDQAERREMLLRDPDRAIIPDHSDFDRVGGRDHEPLNLYMLAPLMGILVLALSL